MMRACILPIVLLLLLSMPGATSAQGPSGGGQPQQEQMIQNNLRMLGDIRENPQAKQQALNRMRERMAGRGVQDIAAKLAAIEKTMDEAASMNDADFEKGKKQLVMRIVSQIRGEGGTPPSGEVTKSPVPWIDVHNHFIGKADVDGAMREALSAMEKMGCERMLVMPTPNDGSKPLHDCDSLASSIRKDPSHFALLGGGSYLNSMIHQTKPNAVTSSLRQQFERKAEDILKNGAIGFGEMSIQHLSLHGEDHPYESVPADHPLFLLLADIAARRNVPIDIHFDVVTEDMPTPEWLSSPNNPKRLSANIAPFERLLSHNPKAKIVWAHAGSDNTGHWTAALSRKLLAKHPNLYMSLRLGPGYSKENFPMTPDKRIDPEWLQLFQDFPNRFVIGGDNFFIGSSGKAGDTGTRLASRVPATRMFTPLFLGALPPDLARKIASENAIAIYKLKK